MRRETTRDTIGTNLTVPFLTAPDNLDAPIKPNTMADAWIIKYAIRTLLPRNRPGYMTSLVTDTVVTSSQFRLKSSTARVVVMVRSRSRKMQFRAEVRQRCLERYTLIDLWDRVVRVTG
eukprot:sb/3476284/